MKHALTFSTNKNNTYLYSPSRNQLLLCHPLIRYFNQIDDHNASIKIFKTELSGKKVIDIPDIGTFQVSEIEYQLRKYFFLKRQGYFKSVPGKNLHGKLYPAMIEENIGNLKQIIFETTETCNLSCTYCTYSKFYINKERSRKKFRLEDAQTMLGFLLSKKKHQWQKELIISFYGGEPLNNFKFIRNVILFLEPYKQKGHRFRYTMSSNGLLLLKHIDFLVEYAIDAAISLDGDEIANSYRVLKNKKASYKLVTKNLDKVRKAYPAYFDKHISFLTVMHNKNSYPSVYRFFSERYQKTPLMSAINTLNINEEFKEEFRDTFFTDRPSDSMDHGILEALFTSHPQVKSMADIVEKYSGYYYSDFRELASADRLRKDQKKYIPTATCLPFSLRVFLSADGSILPCEHIPRIFELGQQRQNNILLDSHKISEDFNTWYEKIRPLCEKCFIHDHCKECMFNTKIETDRPECEFFTDENKFTGFLSQNMSRIESVYSMYLRILKEGLNV